MSDRILVKTLEGRARGSYTYTFKDEVQLRDGRTQLAVPTLLEVPGFRPIPDLVELEVLVPQPAPDVAADDHVVFHGVTIRGHIRGEGSRATVVLRARAETVEVKKG